MSKKAITVDLSIFFDDERKMSFILVDPNWKNVECLQKRVELLFDIDSVRFISNGCFLPPQESIEIIKFCNDLKAFVPKESLEKRKKKSKKCKTVNILEKSENAEIINAGSDRQKQKKRKSDCLISEKDLPHISKRSKASNKDISFEILNPNDKMSQSLHIDNDEDKSTLSKNSKACISKVFEDYKKFEVEKQGVKSQINEINFASTPKEKKMAKIPDDNLEKTVNEDITTQCPSDIPPSTVLHESKILEQRDKLNNSSKPKNPNNPFTNCKSNGGHIYFDECGEIDNSAIKSKSNSLQKKGKETKSFIIFRCPLTDVTNGTDVQKPRVFHLKSKNNTSISKINKQVVEIQEDIILPPHPTQISISELTVTLNKTMKSNGGKQEETNKSTRGSIELDNVNKNNFVYSIIATTTTTTAKNASVEEESANDLEVSDNQEANVTNKQNESTMEVTNVDGDDTDTQNKSHVDKNVTDIKDESELELTNIDENVDEGQNESQTEQKNSEVNLDQVDCVDLSIEEEEDEEEEEITPKEKENHELTAENKSNRSSASDIEEISEIIDLNESEDNSNNKFNNSSECKSSVTNKDVADITVNKILAFSFDLTVLPTVEDVIIFKVPYMNHKNKINCSTNFMAGKVERVNRRTKVIQIFVIDGISELNKVPTRFISPTMDNSLDSSQNGRHLNLKLTDMLEPKLFSKT